MSPDVALVLNAAAHRTRPLPDHHPSRAIANDRFAPALAIAIQDGFVVAAACPGGGLTIDITIAGRAALARPEWKP